MGGATEGLGAGQRHTGWKGQGRVLGAEVGSDSVYEAPSWPSPEHSQAVRLTGKAQVGGGRVVLE